MNIRFNSIICILTSVLFLTACSAQNGTDIPLITPIPTEISEITYDNANLNSVPEYNGITISLFSLMRILLHLPLRYIPHSTAKDDAVLRMRI